MKFTLIFLVASIFAFQSLVCNDFFAGPEFNHKLWKISGKNITKDSYIFVEFNSSHKDVFVVDESVIKAFKKADFIIELLSGLDKDRKSLKKNYYENKFPFKDYFSDKTLEEIKQKIDDDEKYNLAIEKGSAISMLRSLLPKFSKYDTNFVKNLDLSSLMTQLIFMEDKEFVNIFNENDSYIQFINYKDDIKAAKILKQLKDTNSLQRHLKKVEYYKNNNLDLLFNFSMENEYESDDLKILKIDIDSCVNFLIANLGEKSFFTALPYNVTLGKMGLINKLNNLGYNLEPVTSSKLINLRDIHSKFDNSQWKSVRLEKYGVEIELPKLYMLMDMPNQLFGEYFMDIHSYMSFDVQLIDIPEFGKDNPLNYFYNMIKDMRNYYTENASMKQVFYKDSILRFEGSSLRSKFYQKFHFIYYRNKIYRISVMSDTINLKMEYADKYLKSYKFITEKSNKYLYTSPSKDFQFEFSNEPKERLIMNNGVFNKRSLTVVDDDLKNMMVTEVSSVQYEKKKFINDDSLLYDLETSLMKSLNEKYYKYKIERSNLLDYQGFTSLDLKLLDSGITKFHKFIVGFKRFYSLNMVQKDSLDLTSIQEIVQKLKFRTNVDTTFKQTETVSAKFKIPEHLIIDTLVEEFYNRDNYSWGDTKYFSSQNYIDTILGFSFYFKIKDHHEEYFENEETFTKHSINYLSNNFGPYEIVYCKKYSKKVKNSYIFELKSKYSKAVLKGIFYPYKNSIHCLELRTHKVFLDSSYVNEVFDSFEFNFEPEIEQELFRNKLYDLTKNFINSQENKSSYSIIEKIDKIAYWTNELDELQECVELILNSEKTDLRILSRYWSSMFSKMDNLEILEYVENYFSKIKNKNLYTYFILLNCIPYDIKTDADEYIYEKLVQISSYLNKDNIDPVFYTDSKRNNYTIYDELKEILSDYAESMNQDLKNIKKYIKLLTNEYYFIYMTNIINNYVLYQIRLLDDTIIDEKFLIKMYEDKIKLNKLPDEDLLSNIEVVIIYLSKSYESLHYIENNILTNKKIDDYTRLLFYSLNYEGKGFDFDKYFENPDNIYVGYIALNRINKLELLPDKYKNYLTIAQAQLFHYMNNLENPIKIISNKFIKDPNNDDFQYLVIKLEQKERDFRREEESKTELKIRNLTVFLGPYSVNNIDIKNLLIPNNKVCSRLGFLSDDEIEEFINKIKDNEEDCFNIGDFEE